MKKKIDKEFIQQLMGVTSNGIRKSDATVIQNITVFCFGFSFLSLLLTIIIRDIIFVSIIFFMLGCFCAYGTYRSKKSIQDAINGDYYLEEDICLNKIKEKNYDSDSFNTYDKYLIFRKNKKVGPFFLPSILAPYNTEEIYEQACIGDSFYFLYTKKGKVKCIFNRRHWELDESEFVEENGIYIPKEN